MANSVAKDFSIFRFTNPGDTEAGIVDKEAVGMDYGVNEQSDIGVISFRPVGDNRRTDVPNPSQRSSSKPDTGIAGTVYQLDMIVNEKLSDSKAYAKLFKYYLEDNVVRGIFSKGRIGLRNDKFQGGSFDIIPTNTTGFKILHVEAEDDVLWGGFIPISIQLEFGGNPATLIANLDTYIGP